MRTRGNEILEPPFSIPSLISDEELKLDEVGKDRSQNFTYSKDLLSKEKGKNDVQNILSLRKSCFHVEFIGHKIISSGNLKFTKHQYHCFSREEAQLCLKNMRVWVIGDNYL